jgi:hypothetical protein
MNATINISNGAKKSKVNILKCKILQVYKVLARKVTGCKKNQINTLELTQIFSKKKGRKYLTTTTDLGLRHT